MSISEKLEAWLSSQNFTLFNRRQTARKGFEAGWAAKVAEERDEHFAEMSAKRRASRLAEHAARREEQHDKIRKGQRELNLAFNNFAASAGVSQSLDNFKQFAAGWRARKNATYHQFGEDFSPAWLAQRSALFRAGWHSRKLAELKVAVGLSFPYGASVFGRGWAKQQQHETQELDAIRATLEGRNWFRDSTGKIWVDTPRVVPGMSYGIPGERAYSVEEALWLYEKNYWSKEMFAAHCGAPPDDFESLDAGIPTG